MEDLKPLLVYSQGQNSSNSNISLVPNLGINSIKLSAALAMAKDIFTSDRDIIKATEPRNINTNKYQNGSLLVIGGSKEYLGAPLLSALAALRVGAGYVTLLMPKSAYQKLKFADPGLIIRDLGSEKIEKNTIKKIKAINHGALVIGPGMKGENIDPSGLKTLLTYENSVNNITIIDAAAMKIAKKLHLLSKNTIITPHYGEFNELEGLDISKMQVKEKVNAAIISTKESNNTIVLKAHETIITNGKLVKINVPRTPVLATMGSGDVLSGIIGAYSSFHKNPFESSVAGVRLHSKIGDILYKKKGLHVIAQDIIDEIPAVLKEFDKIAN